MGEKLDKAINAGDKGLKQTSLLYSFIAGDKEDQRKSMENTYNFARIAVMFI
jgi:hypothetical protein